MTIKEYAAEQGITPQSVYQRLKKNKIRIESLTEKGTGEITAEGLAVLSKLYDPENRQTKPPKDELIEELNKQVSTLRLEKAELLERVKALEAENAKLSEDKDKLFKALDKEQDNVAEIKKLLPGAGQSAAPAEPIKLTWKERFSGRRIIR